MPPVDREEKLSNDESLEQSEMVKELVRSKIEGFSKTDRLVLLILSISNKIKITRLQKIGLLINAVIQGRVPTSHNAYYFGAFSEDIDDSVTKFSDSSIVNATSDGFVLSPYGKSIINQMKESSNEEDRKVLEVTETIVKALSKMNDNDVLALTYYLFPEFTDDSLIKKEVERRIQQHGIRGVKAYKFKKEHLDEFINRIEKN